MGQGKVKKRTAEPRHMQKNLLPSEGAVVNNVLRRLTEQAAAGGKKIKKSRNLK